MITIKTAKEIESLKAGGKRLSFILSELSKLAVPETSTKMIEDLARKLIKEGGDKPAILDYTPAGAKRAYPASTCVSINDEIVHGIPNEHPKKLKEGDIVTIDGSLIHEGMYVDAAVTVAVGKIPSDTKKLLKATKDALTAGIAQAYAGNRIGDIGHAIEQIAIGHGFSLAEDLCGHGVGYSVHEEPFVPNWGKPGTGVLLRAGMVIAIEPMLCVGQGRNHRMKIKLDPDGYTYRTADGSLSAHFEHTVVVAEGKAVVVTK